MKKTYITPKMKAVKVQASTIICGSTFGITREELNAEEAKNKYSEYEDEIDVAW